MCECAIHTSEKHDWFGEKKFRLAPFFDQWWDDYCMNPKHFIQPEQYKAVKDLRSCRTAALGIDVYTCPECGDITEVYHSCKNRFCPTCSWNDTVRWAEKVKRNMLNIPHRHVVFTLPHQMNFLVQRNKFILLNTLMQTSAETLKDWMSYKYGLQPGIISVLHTAGENKHSHFHTHMILSWGGIDNNRTLQQIKGKFVKYAYLKDKFRKIFEKKLTDLFTSGKLDHSFKGIEDFKRFLSGLNEKKWIINFEEPIDTPEAVIRYIGRYSKRACLSEYKITMMEGEFIGFRYKDYKKKDSEGKPLEKETILNYRDFFPLLLQHVPLPRFRLVRYYGIYSNRGHLPKEYF
ncbi:MAG: transposase, partial [Chloroflexota bacterium]